MAGQKSVTNFRPMKNIFTVLTIIIVISCGQEKKNNDGELQSLEPKPTDLPKTEEVKKEDPKPIGTGKVNSIVDGFDVQRVNLFNSTSSNRTINCYLKNGDKVNVLKDADPYYLVEKQTDKGCKGYCMKEFVILNK
jgi:hypothetical protein